LHSTKWDKVACNQDWRFPVNKDEKKTNEYHPLSRHWRLMLQAIGILLVPIGVAGVILPVLPGVPILILAAACFTRSSPRLEHWLVTHPVLGPDIIAWRERGAIAARAKFFALSMMAVAASLLALSAAHTIIKALVLTGMIGAAAFVATRPDR